MVVVVGVGSFEEIGFVVLGDVFVRRRVEGNRIWR